MWTGFNPVFFSFMLKKQNINVEPKWFKKKKSQTKVIVFKLNYNLVLVNIKR